MIGPIAALLAGIQFVAAGLMLDFSQGEWTMMLACLLWTISLVEHYR